MNTHEGTMSNLTPERTAAIKRAARQLSAELEEAAPRIGALLEGDGCRPVTEQVTGTGSWHPWCPDCGWSGRRYRAKTEAEAAAERHRGH